MTYWWSSNLWPRTTARWWTLIIGVLVARVICKQISSRSQDTLPASLVTRGELTAITFGLGPHHSGLTVWFVLGVSAVQHRPFVEGRDCADITQNRIVFFMQTRFTHSRFEFRISLGHSLDQNLGDVVHPSLLVLQLFLDISKGLELGVRWHVRVTWAGLVRPPFLIFFKAIGHFKNGCLSLQENEFLTCFWEV